MREIVHRCDVCGANDTSDNPVSIRVTGVPLEVVDDSNSNLMGGFLMMFGRPKAHTATVDLCRICAGPLTAMLKAREKYEKSRAIDALANDAFKAALEADDAAKLKDLEDHS